MSLHNLKYLNINNIDIRFICIWLGRARTGKGRVPGQLAAIEVINQID